MSTTFHTPIAAGASNDPASVNDPLGQLDAAITAQVAAEASARAAAVNAEQAARIAADNAEIAARINAIQAEASARIAADALHAAARTAAINVEATARANADALLDDRIDTLIIDSGTSDAETIAARSVVQYPAGSPPATLGDALYYAAGNVYNVEAFGTIGAGSDQDAINAAIEAAWAAGGGVVLMPGTSYTIDGSILYRPNVTLMGRGAGGSGYSAYPSHGSITTAGTLITYTGTGTAITSHGDNITVPNMHLHDFKLTTASGDIGIEWVSCQFCTLDNVIIMGFSEIGLHITGLPLAGNNGPWWNYTRNLVIECGDIVTNVLQGTGIKMTGGTTAQGIPTDLRVRDPNNCYLSFLIRACNIGVHNAGGNGVIFRDADVTTCKIGYLESTPRMGLVSQNLLEGVRMEEHADVDMDYVMFATDPVDGVLLTYSGASGAFQVAEKITGLPSGATAYIMEAGSDYLLCQHLTGTFTAADTITGGTSTRTADVDAVYTPTKNITSIVYDAAGDIVTTSAAHGLKNGMMVKVEGSGEDWLNDRYHRVTDVTATTFRLMGRAKVGDAAGAQGTITVVANGKTNDLMLVQNFGFVRGGKQQTDPFGAVRSPAQWIANRDWTGIPYNAGWLRGGLAPLVAVVPSARWYTITNINDSASPNKVTISTYEEHGLITGDVRSIRVHETTNYSQVFGAVTVTVTDTHTFWFETANTARDAETSGLVWIGDAAAEGNTSGGVKLTCNLAGNTYQSSVNGYQHFRGKYVTVVALVKCATPLAVRAYISDGGVTATPYSHYHSGSGEWERLVVHLDVSSRATSLSAGLRMDAVAAVAYAARVELHEGVIY